MSAFGPTMLRWQSRCARGSTAVCATPRSYVHRSPSRNFQNAPWANPGPAVDASDRACVLNRRVLEASTLQESIRVAGVTFEGRQEVLATVQKREPVQLVREPSNRYDPNAIAVFSLSSGLQLGYVPKESTGMFTSDQICGRVASVGQAGLSGVLGCIVDMRPQLPSLTLPVLPPGMEHCADLSTSGLSQHDVEEVTSGTLAAAGGKCQVTGVAAAAGQALHVVPHWYADLVQRVLWCTGAVAVCAEVHDAMRMLQQPVDARGPAKELMALVNWWSEEEVEAYVRHVVRQQQQLRYVPAELWSVQRWVRPVQQQREGAAVQE